MVDLKEKMKKNDCFKCGEPGHMAYQSPKRNLHIGVEQGEEYEDGHENLFEYAAFDPNDLEEEELDTPINTIVRSILAASKVEKEDWWRTSIF